MPEHGPGLPRAVRQPAWLIRDGEVSYGPVPITHGRKGHLSEKAAREFFDSPRRGDLVQVES